MNNSSLQVQIKNEQSFITLDLKTITEWIKSILVELNQTDKEVSVLFCDDIFIQSINSKYFKKLQPTDVISFSQFEGDDLPFENKILGDIVISTQTAVKQAKDLQHSIAKELFILISHGILHLLGYEHDVEHPAYSEELARSMEILEKNLLQSVFMQNR